MKTIADFAGRSNRERGVAMIIALLTIVIIIAVALTLLGSAGNAVFSYSGFQTKDDVFNAAEAGLAQGLDYLDVQTNQGALPGTSCGSGFVNNMAYQCRIDANNLAGQLGNPGSGMDSAGRVYTVPANFALVEGTADAGGNARKVYVEGIVGQTSFFTLQGDAIDANNNVFLNDHSVLNASGPGLCDATVNVNGDIYHASANYTLDGFTKAAGPNTGVMSTQPIPCPNSSSDNQWNVSPPPVTFPSWSLTQQKAATAKTLAQEGPTVLGITNSNYQNSAPVYVNGDITLASGGTVEFDGPGDVYVNGNVTINNGLLINNNANLWVKGTFSAGGGNTYQACTTPPCSPNTKSNLTILGQDSTTPCANTFPATPAAKIASAPASDDYIGIVFAANPAGSLNLAGNGTFHGSVLAGCNVQLAGNATFDFVIPPPGSGILPGTYKVFSYIEY